MIINQIKFKNFRQFKDETIINFDTTPGKINVVYSPNGGGKTTLHQLIRWVFFGKYDFGHDSTDKLFNVELENELKINDIMSVEGEIEYYCDIFKTHFVLSRKQSFKKEIFKTIEMSKSKPTLRYINDKGDWIKSNKEPVEFLNRQFPESLSHYFLFDGERMVSDFNVKKNSDAESAVLKQTFFSIFELNYLENAIYHIGECSNSVITSFNYTAPSSNKTLELLQIDIEEKDEELTKLKRKFDAANKDKKSKNDEKNELSEKIGRIVSFSQLESDRKRIENQISVHEKNISIQKNYVGDMFVNNYSPLLLSKKAIQIQDILNKKQKNTNLPDGLNVNLIKSLSKVDKCICGETLDDEKYKTLEKWILLLPPKDFKSVYNNFVNNVKTSINNSKNEIRSIEEKIMQINATDEAINELADDKMKIDEKMKNTDKEEETKLVNERQTIEKNILDIEKALRNIDIDFRNVIKDKKSLEKERDDLSDKLEIKKLNKDKLDLSKDILDKLKSTLNSRNESYTKYLSTHLNELILKMFNGERTCSLDENYKLHVYDNYKNESLSEGQFAMVTFAYIGGILKTLQKLKIDKKFPLILDGPFSKLDKIHRENLSDSLPTFANQVIVFSKDELGDLFPKEVFGAVFDIQSNEQKNVATVERRIL